MTVSKTSFLSCQPMHYKQGQMQCIDEIISPEEPCTFSYTCQREGQDMTLCGEKTLYAYPHNVQALVLGHVMLDIAHWENVSYTYEIEECSGKLKVLLKALNAGGDTEQNQSAPLQSLIPDLSLSKILEVMERVLSAPGLWDGTGCFHRAAMFHPLTEELIFAEDIGRHNCIDRLCGHGLMQGLRLEEFYLFTTARITASMYDKIRRTGIKHMVSRAAITSSAYNKAQQEGCTLAAFCRPQEGRVTLFCGDATR